MISEALQDFDILEDGFHRLQNARVLAADYDLLRQHLGFEGEDLSANLGNEVCDGCGCCCGIGKGI